MIDMICWFFCEIIPQSY